MQILRQSSAQSVVLAFVDETDGKTPETGLTIAQADIQLSKNGASYAQSNNSAGASHIGLGHYAIPLDATDTNTVGRLRVAVNESGALPEYRDFWVLSQARFDEIFAGSAKLDVNATELGGTTAATVINSQVASALATYDAPTHAELIAAIDVVANAIAALNNLSSAQVTSAAASAIATYDGPTHAELTSAIATVTSAIAALNNLSSAQAQSAAAAAITAHGTATEANVTAVGDAVSAASTVIDAIASAVTSILSTVAGLPSVGTITASVWAAGSRTLTDKTGFILHATGLDSIPATFTGVFTTFRDWMMGAAKLQRNRNRFDGSKIYTYDDDDTTVLLEEAVSESEDEQIKSRAIPPS